MRGDEVLGAAEDLFPSCVDFVVLEVCTIICSGQVMDFLSPGFQCCDLGWGKDIGQNQVTLLLEERALLRSDFVRHNRIGRLVGSDSVLMGHRSGRMLSL